MLPFQSIETHSILTKTRKIFITSSMLITKHSTKSPNV